MKKLAALISTVGYFITASVVAAQTSTPMQLKLPVGEGMGINPNIDLNTLLANVIRIVFVAAVFLVLFFLIAGAFSWITSSGDKEKVGSARNKIINALIGFAILALAFLILTIVSRILGIDLDKLVIPTLNTGAPS